MSAPVKRFLLELASEETETKRLKAKNGRCANASRPSGHPTAVLGRACTTRRMSPLYFLDANILLYSISGRHAEALKRDRAVDLLERTTGRYRCRCYRNSMQRRPDLRGLTRYPMRSPLV